MKKPRIICKYRTILGSSDKARKGTKNYLQKGDRVINTDSRTPILSYAN